MSWMHKLKLSRAALARKIAVTAAGASALCISTVAVLAADITGRVTDAVTSAPISGAVVILRGSALQAVSSEDGRYAIVNNDRPDGPNFGVPVEPGTYTLEVRAKGYHPVQVRDVKVTADEQRLRVDVQMRPGYRTNFVQVGPSGRYFALEDGTPYVPAGFHHQIVEPDFNAAWDPAGKWGSWWNYEPEKAEAFARALAERGITMIRIFLEEAYILESNLRWALFQDPVGVYNPDVVAHWDQLFDWADKYGFKILVSLYHTDQARRNWRYYPYSSWQGGPASEYPDERWFTDPRVKQAQKRDSEYVIDRWGQRDSFFALDLMNEADAWPGASVYLGEWIDEMADHVRAYTVRRWGKPHLVTVSTGNYEAKGHRETILNNPRLDFVTTHMYWGTIANPQVELDGVIKTDVFMPALEANFTAEAVLAKLSAPKPYFDSEHGPIKAQLPLDQFYIVDGLPSAIVDELYFHNIIWANFVAGAAGVPTRWGFRPDTPLGYRLTDEMLDDIGRLRKFALLFDLATYNPRTVSITESEANRDDLVVMGSLGDREGMFWVLQRREPIPNGESAPIAGAVITVPVSSDGRYRVTVYRTRTGEIGPGGLVKAEGRSLEVRLPEFELDVAFKIEKVE
ncbi:MAG: carboxypeptidase-like regulatory domain-containing protein [Bacillota bacterium]